jgi:hypothetical protein
MGVLVWLVRSEGQRTREALREASCGVVWSTSRMNASCIKAVACSVWLGFSLANLAAARFRSSS